MKKIEKEKLQKKALKHKIIAVATAAGIFASSWAFATRTNEFAVSADGGFKNLDDKHTEELEEEVDLVNDYNFIKKQLIHIMEDAAAKGLQEITVDQWFDWYITMNIKEISGKDFAKFYDDRHTESTILNNASIVNNHLGVSTMTATPNEHVEIEPLLVNDNDAVMATELQELFAKYNVASSSEKAALAKEINEIYFELYATGSFKQLSSSINTFIISKAYTMRIETRNESNKIPEDALYEMMLAEIKDCSLTDRHEANSIYHDVRVLTQTKMSEKIELMRKYYNELGLESMREQLLNEVLLEANIISAEKTALERQIEQNTPDLSEEVVTQRPVTGQDTKTGQEPKTKDEIKEINRDAEYQAEGMKAGFEAGNRDAMSDTRDQSKLSQSEAFPSRRPYSFPSNSPNNKAYRDAYTKAYIQEYDATILRQAPVYGRHHGMSYGVRLVEQRLSFTPISSIQHHNYQKFNGTIFAAPYRQAFNQAAQVAYDEAQQLLEEKKEEYGDDVKGPEVIEEDENTTVIINPGFTTDENGYLYDQNGNPVRDENGNHIRHGTGSNQVDNNNNNQKDEQNEQENDYEVVEDDSKVIYDEDTDTTIIIPDVEGPIYDEDGNPIDLGDFSGKVLIKKRV